MAMSELATVGTRLSHSGFLGTVRFVGQVNGTQGTWLGVEWDEPHRGRHSGEKDGKRYFTCLVPGAGSFLRPSAAISYGTSFLNALVAKYTELPHGSALETVVLGSSRGAIEVEVVGLDRIRSNLSRLEHLREVSLDNEGVSSADPPGLISSRCPDVRGLDLSKNLISTWDTIAQITAELPHLQRLALNQNRLCPPSCGALPASAFAHLRELQLNATLTPWTELCTLLHGMPALRLVETGYNRLTALPSAPPPACPLDELNLDTNELDSWPAVCAALRPFAQLQRAVLASNNFAAIGPLGPADSPLPQLKHLSLSLNRLAAWRAIDALPPWCPALESLTLAGNPLITDSQLGKNARQLAIAKIPTLLALDAAAISAKERVDSELFYLSCVSKHGPADEEARRREHPQWQTLCTKHGAPDVTPATRQQRQDTLGNRLIELHIYHSDELPTTDPTTGNLTVNTASANTTSLRVLPSMSVQTFRMKVVKSLKIARTATVKLWLRMPDGNLAEIDNTQDNRDLDWWGVEGGSDMILYVEDG
ncbi:hypothetical protein B0H21DRAFT_714574 [Amylocystis lapponica]|nr:hypothetical protein B0H21DRAFT_714574 [Amylocystis lapponica]